MQPGHLTRHTDFEGLRETLEENSYGNAGVDSSFYGSEGDERGRAYVILVRENEERLLDGRHTYERPAGEVSEDVGEEALRKEYDSRLEEVRRALET